MLTQLKEAFEAYASFQKENAKLREDSTEILIRRLKLLQKYQAELVKQVEYFEKESDKIERQKPGENKPLVQRLKREDKEIDLGEHGGRMPSKAAIEKFEKMKGELEALNKQCITTIVNAAKKQIVEVNESNLPVMKRQKRVYLFLNDLKPILDEATFNSLKKDTIATSIYSAYMSEIEQQIAKTGTDKDRIRQLFGFKREHEDGLDPVGREKLDKAIAEIAKRLEATFIQELEKIKEINDPLKRYKVLEALVIEYNDLLNKKLPDNLKEISDRELKAIKKMVFESLIKDINEAEESSIDGIDKCIAIRNLIKPVLLAMGELPSSVAEAVAKPRVIDENSAIKALNNLATEQLTTLQKIEKANHIINLLAHSAPAVFNQVKQRYEEIKEQLLADLAADIVYVSREQLSNVNTDELLKPANFSNKEKSPTLSAITAHFNNIADTVKTMLLASPDADAAITNFRDWLRIAAECHQQRDYLAFSAIISVLEAYGLAELLTASEKKLFDDFAKLNSSENSFANMRTALDIHKKQQGIVPPLTIYTHDLEHLNEGNPGKFASMEETQAVITKFKNLAEQSRHLVSQSTPHLIPQSEPPASDVAQGSILKTLKSLAKDKKPVLLEQLTLPLRDALKIKTEEDFHKLTMKLIEQRCARVLNNRDFYLWILDEAQKENIDSFLNTFAPMIRNTVQKYIREMLANPNIKELEDALKSNQLEKMKAYFEKEANRNIYDVIEFKPVKEAGRLWIKKPRLEQLIKALSDLYNSIGKKITAEQINQTQSLIKELNDLNQLFNEPEVLREAINDAGVKAKKILNGSAVLKNYNLDELLVFLSQIKTEDKKFEKTDLDAYIKPLIERSMENARAAYKAIQTEQKTVQGVDVVIDLIKKQQEYLKGISPEMQMNIEGESLTRTTINDRYFNKYLKELNQIKLELQEEINAHMFISDFLSKYDDIQSSLNQQKDLSTLSEQLQALKQVQTLLLSIESHQQSLVHIPKETLLEIGAEKVTMEAVTHQLNQRKSELRTFQTEMEAKIKAQVEATLKAEKELVSNSENINQLTIATLIEKLKIIDSVALLTGELSEETTKNYHIANSAHTQQLANLLIAKSRQVFKAIKADDIASNSKFSDRVRGVPTLIENIDYSTNLTHWVVQSIVSVPNPEQRLLISARWINIAKLCLQNGDMQTTMAINSAFQSAAITRLKDLNNLSEAMKKDYAFISAVCSSERNFTFYNQVVLQLGKGAVPFFGNLSTQITFALDALNNIRDAVSSAPTPELEEKLNKQTKILNDILGRLKEFIANIAEIPESQQKAIGELNQLLQMAEHSDEVLFNQSKNIAPGQVATILARLDTSVDSQVVENAENKEKLAALQKTFEEKIKVETSLSEPRGRVMSGPAGVETKSEENKRVLSTTLQRLGRTFIKKREIPKSPLSTQSALATSMTSLSKSGVRTTVTESILSKKINKDVAELISMSSSTQAEKNQKEMAIYAYAIKHMPTMIVKSAKEGSLESTLENLDQLFSATEKLMTAANVGYFESQWNKVITNIIEACVEIIREEENFALIQNKIINIQERLDTLIAPMKSMPITSSAQQKPIETIPLSEISAKMIAQMNNSYQQLANDEDKVKFLIDKHRIVEDWYLNPPESMSAQDITQAILWLNDKITNDLGITPFVFTGKTLKNVFDDAVINFMRIASKTILNEEELDEAHKEITTLYLQYKLRQTSKDVNQFGTRKTKSAHEEISLSRIDRAYDEVQKQFSDIHAVENSNISEVEKEGLLPTLSETAIARMQQMPASTSYAKILEILATKLKEMGALKNASVEEITSRLQEIIDLHAIYMNAIAKLEEDVKATRTRVEKNVYQKTANEMLAQAQAIAEKLISEAPILASKQQELEVEPLSEAEVSEPTLSVSELETIEEPAKVSEEQPALISSLSPITAPAAKFVVPFPPVIPLTQRLMFEALKKAQLLKMLTDTQTSAGTTLKSLVSTISFGAIPKPILTVDINNAINTFNQPISNTKTQEALPPSKEEVVRITEHLKQLMSMLIGRLSEETSSSQINILLDNLTLLIGIERGISQDDSALPEMAQRFYAVLKEKIFPREIQSKVSQLKARINPTDNVPALINQIDNDLKLKFKIDEINALIDTLSEHPEFKDVLKTYYHPTNSNYVEHLRPDARKLLGADATDAEVSAKAIELAQDHKRNFGFKEIFYRALFIGHLEEGGQTGIHRAQAEYAAVNEYYNSLKNDHSDKAILFKTLVDARQALMEINDARSVMEKNPLQLNEIEMRRFHDKMKMAVNALERFETLKKTLDEKKTPFLPEVLPSSRMEGSIQIPSTSVLPSAPADVPIHAPQQQNASLEALPLTNELEMVSKFAQLEIELKQKIEALKIKKDSSVVVMSLADMREMDSLVEQMRKLKTQYNEVSTAKASTERMQNAIDQAEETLAEFRRNRAAEKSDIAPEYPSRVAAYRWKKEKQGGAQSPGKHGGWYNIKVGDKEKALLIKQDNLNGAARQAVIIAELIGGCVASYLLGDDAAQVFLVRTDEDQGPDKTGENVYLASVGIEGYKSDFWIYAYERTGLSIPEGRPKIVWSENDPIPQAMRDFGLSQFARMMATSLLIGDYDVHAGNIGIAELRNENGSLLSRTLKRLDFGWALFNLSNDVHPHSHLRHLPGRGPTNHFRDFSRDMRITYQMAEELERVSNEVNMPAFRKNAVDAPIDEAAKFYQSIEALRRFAQRLGMKDHKKYTSESQKEELVNALKEYLQIKLEARAKSLKQFAFEIRVDLAIELAEKGSFKVNPEKLRLVNQEYMVKRLFDGQFHFRKTEHKGSNFIDRYILGTTQRNLKNQLFKTYKSNLGLREEFNPTNPKTLEEFNTAQALISQVTDKVWKDKWEHHIEKRFLKNNPEEIKRYQESRQPVHKATELAATGELDRSSKIVTDIARPEEKSLFSYLRNAVISVVDRIRGKNTLDIPLTREASNDEISEALYGSPKQSVVSTDLPPPPSQILAAKAPRDISGKLPPAPTRPTVTVEDLYSDVGKSVEVRSEERIKEQAQSKPSRSFAEEFIKNLEEEKTLWLFVDQDRINEYMTDAKLRKLNLLNKDELIKVAGVHHEVASWLFNHANNVDANYKEMLGDDGMGQIRELAGSAVLKQRSETPLDYQTLTIDQVEQFILDKKIIEATDFVYQEKFASVIQNILPKLSEEHKKAQRDTIQLALIKHNIKTGQQFAVVPPSDYQQKMDNFNASLKLFNNVIVVALHSLLEKLNFTNHYDQLNKIKGELINQRNEIEKYRSALGLHLSNEQIDSMELSATEKEKREELLKDAQAKWEYINDEIKRIENLRTGFTQGVQKKLQAVRTFLPKPPLELPTHTQTDSSITVTPPKPMPDVKEQIYVKVKDKNEFKPLPKEQENTLITEMHFKVDKNSITSYVPRKAYDETALRALAKEMVLKARDAYGKDTKLNITGSGKLLEYAQEELRKLDVEQPALKRENSVRMPPRPRSTPSS